MGQADAREWEEGEDVGRIWVTMGANFKENGTMAEETDSGSEYDFAPKEEETPVPGRAAERESSAEDAAQGKVEERICPRCGFHVVGRTKRNRCPEMFGGFQANGGVCRSSAMRGGCGRWQMGCF